MPNADVLEIEGKRVLVLSVDDYPLKPVSIQGIYYKRVDASDHKLSSEEIANMNLQTMNASWDMFTNSFHSMDDISMEKVQKCMDLLRKNGMTIDGSILPFMEKYNLLREGKTTNAAYLLYKHDHSDFTTIELGRFQDEITIKDSARSKTDIISQVDEVIGFVRKHINCAIVITGDPQNIQKWQYPLPAIREIVINMIIHRDYRSTSDSIVKVFNDKIEFYNPGRLPESITVEDLVSNNYKSTPRNRKIADVFKDFGWIEKYGSGIRRIINQFKEAGSPLPEFRNISEGFQVTVYSEDYLGGEGERVTDDVINDTRNIPEIYQIYTNKATIKQQQENHNKTTINPQKTHSKPTEKPQKDYRNVTETLQKDHNKITEKLQKRYRNVTDNDRIMLTKNQIKIMEFLYDNPHATSNEISENVGIVAESVRQNIIKLKGKGLIERIGADRGGYWKVVKIIHEI